jgi:putative holliday junction resolvase
MSEFKSARPKATRIASIDYGLARIGLAISDETKTIAMPLKTLQCEKKTEDTAKKLVQALEDHQKEQNYSLQEIVIGLPLMMSGKMGFLADETQYFIELLKKMVQVPIVSWDERLTSVQADRSMREGNLNRKKRAKSVDNVAAIIILQSYLDHLKLRSDV